jgi:PEP-CTERM motif
MENIFVLDALCTWRRFSRLLLIVAATVLALAGSLGIAKGSQAAGCPGSPITFAMALQLDVPAGSDSPCTPISDFLLAPSSEGSLFFSFFSDLGDIPTTFFEAENVNILDMVNGNVTIVGKEAALCYYAYNAPECYLPPDPLGTGLGLGLDLFPFGIVDSQDSNGDLSSIHGEVTVYLSGTVGGQPATLGLVIYDDPFGPKFEPIGALIAIPEPSTYAMLGIGGLAIVVFRRKIGRTVL